MSFSIVRTLTDIKDAITNKASLQTEITNLQTELAAIKSNIAGLPDYATVLAQINTTLGNIAGIGAVADLDVNDLSATLARVNETLSLGTLTVGGDIVLTDLSGGRMVTLDSDGQQFNYAKNWYVPISHPGGQTQTLDISTSFAAWRLYMVEIYGNASRGNDSNRGFNIHRVLGLAMMAGETSIVRGAENKLIEHGGGVTIGATQMSTSKISISITNSAGGTISGSWLISIKSELPDLISVSYT